MTGIFLDADDAENITASAAVIGGLDRNAVTLDNHMNAEYNDDNIFTSGELYADVTYDKDENKSWWELYGVKVVVAVLFIVALVISVILAACGYPGMLITCIYAGLNAATWALAITGTVTWLAGGDTEDILNAMAHGAVEGFATAFVIAAIIYGITSAIKALIKVANKAKPKPTALDVNGFSKNDPIQNNYRNVRGIKGYTDVAIHGNTQGVELNGQMVSAKEFAGYLKSNPEYSGGNIRLLSCNTGKLPNGFAKQLASELGVKVLAPRC